MTIKPVLHICLALKLGKRNIPLIAAIFGLGYAFTANFFRTRMTKLIASAFFKIALSHKYKAVIFQNTSDEAILTEVVRLTATDKTLIKGPCADFSVYNYLPENTNNIIKIALACRLLKGKDVYQFADAAKIVKKKHDNVEFLLVVGTLDLDNLITVNQTEIDTWVKQSEITYLVHRNDMSDVFSNSNIICLPSFYGKGVPKVLIETGGTVPIRDSKTLAIAILQLIEQPELRIAMGTKAKVFAEKEFEDNSLNLLVSGGIDSTCLLGLLHRENKVCNPILCKMDSLPVDGIVADTLANIINVPFSIYDLDKDLTNRGDEFLSEKGELISDSIALVFPELFKSLGGNVDDVLYNS